MMTVGDLRQIVADPNIPDDTPVIYAWIWRSPEDVCLGSYLDGGGKAALLLDGAYGPFNNKILWEQKSTNGETQ